MQGIRDRGWAVCCGQEVDSGDAWVESRRKRASAKQPEEIIRKDKQKMMIPPVQDHAAAVQSHLQ